MALVSHIGILTHWTVECRHLHCAVLWLLCVTHRQRPKHLLVHLMHD